MPRRQRDWQIIGLVIAGLAVVAGAIFALLTLLSANACGMFADGCEDYGKPADGFELFASLTFLSGLAFVGGMVMTIVGTVARRDQLGSDPTIN